jgi:hypothetical protein
VDFLKRGTEENYERVIAVLKGSAETSFDPDDVPA